VVVGTLLLLGAVALWRGRPTSPTLLVHNSEVVSTKSEQAREYYRSGLEAYYARGNQDEALAQMEAAAAADSTFAMAAYWVVKILDWKDGARTNRYMAQALRMAPFASPAERQLIELQRAMVDNDPRVQPLAELLANQFPDDPEILVVASRVALTGGAYARSLELARRVIQLDTVRPPPSGPCASCDGYELLTLNLLTLDSLPAIERIVRTWRAARPDDLRADRFMAMTLELLGRYDEARVIAQQMADRGRGQVSLLSEGVSIAIRQGDIAAAEAAVRLARKASPDSSDEAPDWYSVAVLRHAGRLSEAQRMVTPRLSLEPTGWNVFPAEVAFEAGQSAEAAAIARRYVDRPWPVPGDSTISVRMMCWWLTRASTYFAAAGDTTALAVTARRLEQLGKLSAFGRDQRAYHYPLALLAEARRQWADAEAEFRAAVLAPSDGYTRINLQLGQLLQRQGRATEAVPIFQSALHTDAISGSTLYVTQTELHEALGQAFGMLNQPDSARVHYDYVVRVWAHADQPFQSRLAAAKAYLGAHPAP
jgi:tetratricopeptide (TPR) repeat protein